MTLFRRRSDGREASTIAELVMPGDRIDLDGIAAALDVQAARTRTFVQEIEPVVSRRRSFIAPRSIEALLGEALVDGAAYALAGGIDAALLLAIARRRGLRPIAYTLRPRLRADRTPSEPSCYDEHEAAIATAMRLGVELRIVEATDDAFRQALPAALRAIETPLYNLHPVARLILAERVAADGFSALVTGDGADQRCANTDGADYLPLVAKLTRAAGLTLVCPYLSPALGALEGDAEKRGLRELLARDLPELAAAQKRAKLAPPIVLDGLVDEARVAELARALGTARLPPGDRARVGLVTSVLLERQLGLR